MFCDLNTLILLFLKYISNCSHAGAVYRAGHIMLSVRQNLWMLNLSVDWGSFSVDIVYILTNLGHICAFIPFGKRFDF